MQIIQKGVVQAVYAQPRGVQGVLMSGAEFFAYYYGSSPAIGDIVFVAQVADGSWVVITGPSQANGLFGVGGDRDITITQSTAADAASRTTSADGVGTSISLNVTSASGAFTAADVGKVISGGALVAGTYITAVNSSTSIQVSSYPTAAFTGAALTITSQNTRWTKSATTFTLARDLYCVNLILDPVDGPFALKTNGYRIFCLGTLLVGAGITVHNNGNDAVTVTPGGNAAAGAIGRAVGAGAAAAASGAPASGTAAANVTDSAATLSTTAKQSGGQGALSYHIPSSTVAYTGGRGGTVVNAITNGWPGAAPDIVRMAITNGTTLFAGGAGGGSGMINTGASPGTARPGAGGGGGGVLAIFARQIVNLGTISANGGVGGDATLGTGTDVAVGGGGGGGGGVVVLVFGAAGSTVGQVLAEGGSAGGGLAQSGGLGTSVDSGGITAFALADVVTAGAGGAPGASAAVGAITAFYTTIDATNGAPGLIWALPL